MRKIGRKARAKSKELEGGWVNSGAEGKKETLRTIITHQNCTKKRATLSFFLLGCVGKEKKSM